MRPLTKSNLFWLANVAGLACLLLIANDGVAAEPSPAAANRYEQCKADFPDEASDSFCVDVSNQVFAYNPDSQDYFTRCMAEHYPQGEPFREGPWAWGGCSTVSSGGTSIGPVGRETSDDDFFVIGSEAQ